MQTMAFAQLIQFCSTLILVSPPATDSINEPYCGIYCLYAALHSYGVDLDVSTMIVPENLSGAYGSTAQDLMRLAQSYGVDAELRKGMTADSLRSARGPCILHTSLMFPASGLHHWILYYGMDGEKVRIYDPPHGLYSLSIAELQSHWDGIGVVIKQRGDSDKNFRIDHETVFAVSLIILFWTIVSHTSLASKFPISAIVVPASAAAILWHVSVDIGFLRRGNDFAIASVTRPVKDNEFPEITAVQLQDLIQTNDTSIIDSRQPSSYHRSHLPRAINIPTTITYGLLRDTLKKIPLTNRLVVYCRSEECEWSDQVAQLLNQYGYRHILIYRGGYQEWSSLSGDK